MTARRVKRRLTASELEAIERLLLQARTIIDLEGQDPEINPLKTAIWSAQGAIQSRRANREVACFHQFRDGVCVYCHCPEDNAHADPQSRDQLLEKENEGTIACRTRSAEPWYAQFGTG